MTRTVALIMLLVLPLASGLAATTPIIETMAGGGGPNNVPAVTTNLKDPAAMVIGPAGELFMAIAEANRVYRVDKTGLLIAVAGNWAPAHGGDGGLATNASLLYPTGLAFDAGGNLFISTYVYVRRVDAITGIITTIAGNGSANSTGDDGPALQAGLWGPTELAFDAAGYLYILESDRVRRVNMTTGIISAYAGGGNYNGDGLPALNTYLARGQDIAFDALGNLLIVQGGRVRKVDRQTTLVSTVAGGGVSAGDGIPATQARLDDPTGLSIDPAGNFFISQLGGHTVRRVDWNGIITTVAGTGSPLYSGDGGAATAAGLSPWKVVVNGAGDLFIGGWQSFRVRKVSGSTGVIDAYAGNGGCCFFGEGVPAREAELNSPRDAVVDRSGNIFVLDNGNARVRRVDHATGLIHTVAGNGSHGFSGDAGQGTAASINVRYGGSITVDAAGNAYIADTGNRRVRRVDVTTGIITTVAGNGSGAYNGDDIPATQAAMIPAAVTIDSLGNLLVLDAGSFSVRRVDASTGLIQTLHSGLSYPNDIAIDLQGNLFIAEGGYFDEMNGGLLGSNQIRRIDAVTGIHTTVAHAWIPLSVAVDDPGNVFFSLSINDERGPVRGGVLGVDPSTGSVNWVTNPAPYYYSCWFSDGGPAADTGVCFPAGVNVDQGGNLFVADVGYSRIRRIRRSNVAPVARAGGDITAACNAPGGAAVTLDGSASYDLDSRPGTVDDIASWEWFENFGLPGESSLGTGQTVDVILPEGAHVVTLRVTDLAGTSASDVTVVTVEVGAPNGLTISFNPETLWPPNHRLVDVTATVLSDSTCGSPLSSTLVSVTSSEPDDAPGGSDGTTEGDIQDATPGTADFDFRLRAERDTHGAGRAYTFTYLVSNSAGEATVTGDLIVPHDRGGVTDPVNLTLSGTPAGTLLAWDTVPGATHYNVIRGAVSGIKRLGNGVDLRSAACIASHITAANTHGHEDPTLPAPGQIVYYLVEYDDGNASGYGTAEADEPLQVPSGICF